MKDDLGDRMKKYEYITRTHLMPRTPVIIRLDGKAFHTFTRGFRKPFDDVLIKSMQETMLYLCENIQGCVLGYTQSDEITLVLVDYKKLDSSSWFDYNIQKCVSVASSMATFAFNKSFDKNIIEYFCDVMNDENRIEDTVEFEYMGTLVDAKHKGAMFDARVFNIPKEEVTNCLLWRQNDAVRNSIQMVGQVNFTHRELQNKSCNDIQNMLLTERDINWNDYATKYKRGSCCIKVQADGEIRPKWIIDNEIPIFKGDGRAYVDNLVYIGEQTNELQKETTGEAEA